MRVSWAGAAPAEAWNQGQVVHLIPTASHERFLIKSSFKTPVKGTPRLTVNGKAAHGVQTDQQGRFWRFDATSLKPAMRYELKLVDGGRAPALRCLAAQDLPGAGRSA